MSSQKSRPPPSAPPPGYAGQPPPQPPYTADVLSSSSLPPHPTWSTGICDCTVDIPICCLTCWCPCITFGQIAEIVDHGKTSCGVHATLYAILNVLGCCGCLYSCGNRTKMRHELRLLEIPVNDFCVHFCCASCALCQEYRELRHHGLDMTIGWQGNVERWMVNNGAQIPPTSLGGMFR